MRMAKIQKVPTSRFPKRATGGKKIVATPTNAPKDRGLGRSTAAACNNIPAGLRKGMGPV